MNDRDIGMSPEPPDEPEVFIECDLCLEVENLEEATRAGYSADYICLKCRNTFVKAEKESVDFRCRFCGDSADYKVEIYTDDEKDVYVCIHCDKRINGNHIQ